MKIYRQNDMGLERFDTKDLFVRLVTPTFFVIIAVIQLQYFHNEFMEISRARMAFPVYDRTPESQVTIKSKIDLTNLASRIQVCFVYSYCFIHFICL